MGNSTLSILFICVAIVSGIAIYTSSLEAQTAAKNGLQECVATSSHGNTFTVWQKECQGK